MTSRISIIEIKYTQSTQFYNVDTLTTSSYNLYNTTIHSLGRGHSERARSK